jgi:hypothetical protein
VAALHGFRHEPEEVATPMAGSNTCAPPPKRRNAPQTASMTSGDV